MAVVLLLHLDGKLPNLALMRIAAHHRAIGDHGIAARTSADCSPGSKRWCALA